MDNWPIAGCSGCATTGGRMACPYHGGSQIVGTVTPTGPMQGWVCLRCGRSNSPSSAVCQCSPQAGWPFSYDNGIT